MILHKKPKGVSLVELLVVIAILGLLLSGIYGILNSANQMFVRTRALVESQQVSRVVMNYLTYRLRQIDGSGLVENPTNCMDCHQVDQDFNPAANDVDIPCFRDVLIPRQTVFLEELKTLSVAELPSLSGGIDAAYQNVSGGNYVRFWADMLPTHGLSDTFTDAPFGHAKRNAKWDLINYGGETNKYDPGLDRELLFYDFNDNGLFDYYAEEWTLTLKKAEGKNYYELIESLSFEKKDSSGTVIEDYSAKNKSSYSAYTSIPVASGIVKLGIKKIPRLPANYPPSPGVHKLGGDAKTSCGGSPTGGTAYNNISGVTSATLDGCHGENASKFNVYNNETAFNYDQFLLSHSSWNIKGFVIDLVTVDPTGKKFYRTQQFITPRNVEVNQERVETF